MQAEIMLDLRVERRGKFHSGVFWENLVHGAGEVWEP